MHLLICTGSYRELLRPPLICHQRWLYHLPYRRCRVLHHFVGRPCLGWGIHTLFSSLERPLCHLLHLLLCTLRWSDHHLIVQAIYHVPSAQWLSFALPCMLLPPLLQFRLSHPLILLFSILSSHLLQWCTASIKDFDGVATLCLRLELVWMTFQRRRQLHQLHRHFMGRSNAWARWIFWNWTHAFL